MYTRYFQNWPIGIGRLEKAISPYFYTKLVLCDRHDIFYYKQYVLSAKPPISPTIYYGSYLISAFEKVISLKTTMSAYSYCS